MVTQKMERYSPLLVWAVLRKLRLGIRAIDIERLYGIPHELAMTWERRAIAEGAKRRWDR